MRHWLSLREHEPQELQALVTLARRFKSGQAGRDAQALNGRILTMLFFNPSLRTRTSFEAAMLRYGGHAITLSVGGDAWQLEYRDGVVMDGEAAEHIREAAPVISRYGDLLAVRTFAGLKDPAEDAADPVLRAFARYATVPVINMESAAEHPCQGLADWLTMEEKLGGAGERRAEPALPTQATTNRRGEPALPVVAPTNRRAEPALRGRRFTLSWAPHVKGLPMAVPNSAVLAAAAAGMQVTIAHPPGYELNAAVVDQARRWCTEADAEFAIAAEQVPACRAADVLYVKSWGATGFYGDAVAQRASFREHARWTVTREHLGAQTRLMHCLPVRRNLVIADEALDDPRSIVVDQAENRLWAQAAILSWLLQASA